jgi:hypothetical protein
MKNLPEYPTNFERLKVVIPTCDHYVHILEALLYTLEKFWPCNSEFIVLGYSSPKFELKPNWKFVSLGQDTGPNNWANDLLRFFNTFDEEYFVFMADDVLMTRMSDLKKAEFAFNYMLKNKEVKKCFLQGSLTVNTWMFGALRLDPVEELGNIFYDVNQVCEYRSSLQIAIWSTQYFLECLKPGMSPWDFELQAKKNDGARILTTKENHPVMFSHLYRKGFQLESNWYTSVFEDTQLPMEDVIYVAKLLNINL